jgi:hypothetical protein
MDEAAPGEAPAAVEKKRRLLRRFPVSLLTTLLGIALTAWLLPAFTRQWDDRQKAHELKASLAAQVAVATARSLTRSREELRIILAKPNGGEAMFPAAYTHLDESWFSDSVEIEAKLRAYIDSPEILAQLHAFNVTMQTLFQLSTDPWTMYDYSHGSGSAGTARHDARLLGIKTTQLRSDLRYLVGNTSAVFTAPGGANDSIFEQIANGVLTREQALVAGISAAHVDGYSTTARDLLHDLVP